MKLCVCVFVYMRNAMLDAVVVSESDFALDSNRLYNKQLSF